MADAAVTKRQPRRRRIRLRFSLRTFLIAVTLIGVLLGWFGRELARVRRQREVVNQLLASRATVYFDYQFQGSSLNRARPPAPKTLRWMFGDDLFTHVVYVEWNSGRTASDKLVAQLPQLSKLRYVGLAGANVSDQSIACLQRLPLLHFLILDEVGIQPVAIGELSKCPKLTRIVLKGRFVTDAHLKALKFGDRLHSFQLSLTPNVSDEGISALAGLTNLEYLDIDFAPNVSNSGVAALASLQHLKSLNSVGTGIRDAALQDIGRMAKLERLGLDGHPITDAGVTALVGLKNLRSLQLSGTRITDVALGTVGRFKELDELNLRGTQIGDAGLAHLTGLSKLASLVLVETEVTDDGLLQLKDVKSLRYLNVSLGLGVSREGVLRLKEFLPQCNIDCWAPGPSGAGGGEYLQATE